MAPTVFGSSSDYMARLKLQEVLLGRLVKLKGSPTCAVAALVLRQVLAAVLFQLQPRQPSPAPSPTTPIKPSASWLVIW